jgi:hypothetical protein
MPLIFPSSASLNQTYQSGSSAVYQYNGQFWTVVTPPTTIFATAITASFSNTGSSMVTRPQIAFRKTQQNSIALNTDTLVNWDISDFNTISNLSYSSGVFTNTAARQRTFIVEYQAAVRLTDIAFNIIEHNIFITYNGTPLSTNRIAETVVSPVSNWAHLHRLSTVVHLNQNDTIRCYEFVTSAGATTFILSGNEYGYFANHSTRLKITELT